MFLRPLGDCNDGVLERLETRQFAPIWPTVPNDRPAHPDLLRLLNTASSGLMRALALKNPGELSEEGVVLVPLLQSPEGYKFRLDRPVENDISTAVSNVPHVMLGFCGPCLIALLIA